MRSFICIFIFLCASTSLGAVPVVPPSSIAPRPNTPPPSIPKIIPPVPATIATPVSPLAPVAKQPIVQESPGSFIDKSGIALPIAPTVMGQDESVTLPPAEKQVVPHAPTSPVVPNAHPKQDVQYIAPKLSPGNNASITSTHKVVDEKPKDVIPVPTKPSSDLFLPELPPIKEEVEHPEKSVEKKSKYSFTIPIPKIIFNLLPKPAPTVQAVHVATPKPIVVPVSPKPAPAVQAVQVATPKPIVVSVSPKPAPAVQAVHVADLKPIVAPVPTKPVHVAPSMQANSEQAHIMKTIIVSAQDHAKGPAAVMRNMPSDKLSTSLKPKQIVQSVAGPSYVDKDLAQFINEEIQILAMPDDDVVLGHVTNEYKFSHMGYSQYLSLYQRYRESIMRLPQFQANELFLDSHRKIDGHDTPILSDRYLFSLALRYIEYNKLDDMRVLANNYKILGFVDNHGNSLLHLAAVADDVYLTKWLIMRGVNVNAINDDSISAKDIAEYEQYWGVFNLLESANAQ